MPRNVTEIYTHSAVFSLKTNYEIALLNSLPVKGRLAPGEKFLLNLKIFDIRVRVTLCHQTVNLETV